MPAPKLTTEHIAAHIRRVLKDGGSAPHAEGVQRFFKEEIRSRGWYSAELRSVAVRFRRTILRECGQQVVEKPEREMVFPDHRCKFLKQLNARTSTAFDNA